MGQSLVKCFVHLIFSTKHRKSQIDESIEGELHRYLGGICTQLQCPPIKIGGYVDHVHLLYMQSKKIALMKFLEELKSHSSAWMKTKGEHHNDFYWQGGYGAFSVSPSDVESVKKYIEGQHEHHKVWTFQDEYRRILSEHNVDFDERYLWD